MKEIEFLAKKARLTTQGPSLDDIASIDDVRCIGDVGEVVTYNDETRRILWEGEVEVIRLVGMVWPSS